MLELSLSRPGMTLRERAEPGMMMQDSGPVFIGKPTHLRREMGAALAARARRVCITSQAALPRVFFLFLVYLDRPSFASLLTPPPPTRMSLEQHAASP